MENPTSAQRLLVDDQGGGELHAREVQQRRIAERCQALEVESEGLPSRRKPEQGEAHQERRKTRMGHP